MVPVGREVVMIIGAPSTELMVILSVLASLPAAFVALTVKLNVSATVGVPEITPVFGFNTKPPGKLPLSSDQVIGAVPVAMSV